MKLWRIAWLWSLSPAYKDTQTVRYSSWKLRKLCTCVSCAPSFRQVRKTFAYFDQDYGLMNEKQVAIAESTVGAKTVGRVALAKSSSPSTVVALFVSSATYNSPVRDCGAGVETTQLRCSGAAFRAGVEVSLD
jgi:hypothetical protein